ncbi:glutaminase [Bradyrhizobium commune]|uniref:glutaminase n=1 Tax=Bradyrhizobium commune TaxID=83627 RepID=UPI0034A574C6
MASRSVVEEREPAYVSIGHIATTSLAPGATAAARWSVIHDGLSRCVVDASVCHYALAVMITAGLYETSGDWLYDIGLPGKSGIDGGIVAVSPGKGGFGTFAPPLDAAGNSVRGQLAAKLLSHWLGMDLFVSQPEQ